MEILPVNIEDELKRSYIEYALAVIEERVSSKASTIEDLERTNPLIGKLLRERQTIEGQPHRSLRYYKALYSVLIDEIIGELQKEHELTRSDLRRIRIALRQLYRVFHQVPRQTEETSESINRLLRSGGRGLRSPPYPLNVQ